ncbi:MAG TPA: hypothetical protein VM370_08490 [Candidatus Thermoplasmatota archaeon]|nr:hypothetical protein [Candidatus Thermoplasmatota archaeon]
MAWNVNKILLVAGALLILAASAIQVALVPTMLAQTAPLWVGGIVALILMIWARPWMYLVGGILAALFPLVVIFVFGASGALTHPGSGIEGIEILLLLAGAILALVGGIAGFVQGRRHAQPPASMGLRAPQVLAAALIAAMVLSYGIANVYASGDTRALAERPIAHADSVDLHVRVVTTGVAYAPRPINIPMGKLVSLDIENGDPFVHTFSYHLDGTLHEQAIPASSKMSVLMKFDTPQTIHVWCAPHSQGPDDRDPASMWTDMVVG